MKDGISGAILPAAFPYAKIINNLALQVDFFPCLVGAVKMNETGLGKGPTTETDISGDGGHGIMQLTSSYPSTWQEPAANIGYAIDHFLLPAYAYWREHLQGNDLVRAIAATFNAGLGNAQAGHNEGNVDRYTTNYYAARALRHYQDLTKGVIAL